MMLMTSPQNSTTPNFTGLTKVMKRQVFIDGKKDISELLGKRDSSKNTHVGELPPFIFYALPKENRPHIIKEFFDTFDKTSDEIRNFKPSLSSPAGEYKNKRPQASVDRLKNLFNKYNLLENPDKFDMEYLGEGEYKKAFKLTGIKDEKRNEEYCFKIFHLVDKTPEWHKYKSHGNFAELNIVAYWKKAVGQETQRGKFYFGDINNGYMVDRFVDETIHSPQRLIDEYNYGIKITDEVKAQSGHNKLYGYSIDAGGSRGVNRIKKGSKTARYVLSLIKEARYEEREALWYRILNDKKLDKAQKQAGLAISIKHLHMSNKENFVKKCLAFNQPLADMGLDYMLKYLPDEQASKYFEILMKRKNPKTQTVLLNEIPLISRHMLERETLDDLDVPRGEINSQKIEQYYKIAQKYVLPEVEEHLASYIHLLPKDKIILEADNLVAKHNYNINDRLLHKIKFVSEDQFSFSDKMAILDKVEKNSTDNFILNKTKSVRTKIIRDSLGDD